MRPYIEILSIVLLLSAFHHLGADVAAVEDGALEQIVRFDLDTDDGGFLHGGPVDPWEWGVPGDGTMDDPGPGGGMGGAWGAPLNGTYPNGTDSYLELPMMDTSLITSLRLTFLAWYDLSTAGGSGDPPSPQDSLRVMLSASGSDWRVVKVLTGSTSGQWSEVNISLDEYVGGPLTVRLSFVDDPDGLQGRGVILDGFVLQGSTTDPVPVHFTRPAAHPTYVSAFDLSHFSYFLGGGPVGELGECGLRIVISGEDERVVLDRSIEITGSMQGENTVQWTPDAIGQFWVDMVLEGDGTDGDEMFFTCFAIDPVSGDDMEGGLDGYSIEGSDGGLAGWFSVASPPGCLSSSRGKVIKAGRGPDPDDIFNGTIKTSLITDWIDLTLLGTSTLSFHHTLQSAGPPSTCGLVVEALAGGEEWVGLVPDGDDPSFGGLGGGSGVLAGSMGFRGPYDWRQSTMDLGMYTGARTKVRFSLSSGESGSGGGLFLDDILVWGDTSIDDTTPPVPVEGLTVTIEGEGRVRLRWTPSGDDDLMLYRIYVGTGTFDGLGELIPELEVPAYEASAVVTGLDPDMLYWAVVTAVDSSGNEGRDVSEVTFTPSIQDQNGPPTAVITAVYGTQRRLGEDFIFDGSASTDPDNDHLTYLWTLPDGSSDRGARTRWRSSSVGSGLVVVLMVTDTGGATSNATVSIDVLPEEEQLIGTGNLAQFLICLLPLVVVAMVVILVLIILRNIRRVRYKERLKEAGVEIVGPREAQEGPSPTVGRAERRTVQPRVLDLVPAKGRTGTTVRPRTGPIKVPEKLQPPKHPHHQPVAEPPQPQQKAEPLRMAPTPHPDDVPKKDMVKVTLECPFCGSIFKESVGREAMKKGGLENVVCPECGRKGEIIG